MLNMKKQRLGETIVVHCSGRIVFPDADCLRIAVLRLPRTRKLVLDLAEVIAVDAAGLGAFVSLHHWAKQAGTELRLMNVSSRVKYLIEITGLHAVLEVCSVAEMLRLVHCSREVVEPLEVGSVLEARPEVVDWLSQDSGVGG